MDIDSISKGKENEFHLAIAFGCFKPVIGEYAVIDPLGTGSLFINFLPLISVARYGCKQTKIVFKSDIDNRPVP